MFPEPDHRGRSVAPATVDLPVSVVVPVLNGEATLVELHRRLSASLTRCAPDHEIVFVDDGSRDRTWSILTDLAAVDPRVRCLRLARNSGHAAAISAGFSAASGSIVAMIDADLETHPEEMPKLLLAVAEGADLASGARTSRRRWERQLGSRIFNAHARRLGLPLHDVGCGMNAMTAAVAQEFVACGHVGRTLVKPYLYAFSRTVVEVSVASDRPMDTRLRVGDLVTLWFKFDILQRPLALWSVAMWGLLGALVALVEFVLALVDAVPGHRVTLFIGSVLTLLMSVMLTTLSLAAGLALRSVADREAPYFRVVEQAGGSSAPD